MMNKPTWLDSFLDSFAQVQDSDKYTYQDQKTMIRDYSNTSNQNLQDSIEQGGKYETKAEDPQTGEAFALEINEKPNGKSKREDEWIQREMTVTFTSLNDSSKTINSTLSSLCGGKYAELSSKELPEIASILSANVNSIFNYADSTIANYSDHISPEQAFRISKSISEKNNISYFDYEKICSKLNAEHLNGFNSMLKSANIKIEYPMRAIEAEINEKKKVIEAQSDESQQKQINYYIDLFKSFKEYKLADREGLAKRVATILPVLSEEIVIGVVDGLKKENII